MPDEKFSDPHLQNKMQTPAQIQIQNFLNHTEEFSPNLSKQFMRLVLSAFPYEEYSIEKIKKIFESRELLTELVEKLLSDITLRAAVTDELVHLLTILGQTARWYGDYRGALKYLESARRELSSTENSSAVLSVTRELGRIKYFLNDHQGSRKDLEDALERELFAENRNDLLLARIHTDLSLTLARDPSSSFAEALSKARRAYEIASDGPSASRERDLVLAEARRAMAICYRWMNQRLEARENFERSADLFEKTLGADHPTVVGAFHNLGILGFIEGFEEFVDVGLSQAQSRIYIEKAWQNNCAIFGERHPLSVISYQWLSQMMYVQNDLAAALESRQRVIDLWTEINGPDSLDLLYSYYWLGRIFEKMAEATHTPQNLVNSLHAYQVVLEIAKTQALDEQISYFSDHVIKARLRIDEITKKLAPISA